MFDNGAILVYEVLCPHRDKSDFYVHIHQYFQWSYNGLFLYMRFYVDIETGHIRMHMSTYSIGQKKTLLLIVDFLGLKKLV